MTQLNYNIIGKRRSGLMTIVIEVFLLVLSALIFSASFPGFISSKGIGILGFIALIPMFAVIRNTGWVRVPFYGFLFGFIFFIFFNYWLASFHPLAVYIAPIIMGTEMIILFPILKAADKLFPKYGFLLQLMIWVGYEYLKTLGFVGYPYGIVGYSQYAFIPFIQMSSVFGIWGVTLMTVFPSIILSRHAADCLIGKREKFTQFIKTYKFIWIGYGVLFIAALLFGFISISRLNNEVPDRIWRPALVQHNADSWEGGIVNWRKNLRTLMAQSNLALEEDPDIVIWSETAFVISVYWHTNYRTSDASYAVVEEFVNFANNLPVPLLTGNNDNRLEDPDLPPKLSDGTLNREDHNAVILYEGGGLKDIYWKQNLVPFTEGFPYGDIFPKFNAMLLANDYHYWIPGDDPVVFRTEDGVKFSTPICFEDVFGDLSAKFVQAGADVLVNMTNDSWSGALSAQMQHMAMGAFRSVEVGRTTVRGTNSGMTCVIDPAGRVLDMMEPFTVGYMVPDAPIYTYKDTLYARWVDWFPKVLIVISLILLAAGLVRVIIRKAVSRKTH
jgi:apolipoprotein N-acyltransferase